MNPRHNLEKIARFWTAPAGRSGDGAFVCDRSFQSGVALRLPPQSKFAPVMPKAMDPNHRLSHIGAGQFLFKLI